MPSIRAVTKRGERGQFGPILLSPRQPTAGVGACGAGGLLFSLCNGVGDGAVVSHSPSPSLGPHSAAAASQLSQGVTKWPIPTKCKHSKSKTNNE